MRSGILVSGSAPLPVLHPFHIGWHRVAFWLLAHGMLAVAASRSSHVATLHALFILGYGLVAAYNKNLIRVAFTGAYIAGAEVLWRMCHAQVNWEFGKYAIILVFGVALARTDRLRSPLLPLLFFVFLLPSAWLSGQTIPWGRSIELLSFYLSGPLALCLCAWLFSLVTITPDRLRMIILAFLGPVAAIATKALFSTMAMGDVVFSTESNAVTAGGFGPNQVSPMLGLGALLAVFYVVSGRVSAVQRLLMVGLALGLIMQSGLTFSRSGIAIALLSLVLSGMFLLRDARSRMIMIGLAAGLILFVQVIMIPVLDDFTHGAFTQRYTDRSPSNRDKIAMNEIALWMEHPVAGVGPGRASMIREERFGTRIATHTEYTRMLAEHGAFGLLSLIFLFGASVQRFRMARDPKSRAFVTALIVWSLLFLAVNAFRLATPAFAFGMTFALFQLGALPITKKRKAPIVRIPNPVSDRGRYLSLPIS